MSWLKHRANAKSKFLDSQFLQINQQFGGNVQVRQRFPIALSQLCGNSIIYNCY